MGILEMVLRRYVRLATLDSKAFVLAKGTVECVKSVSLIVSSMRVFGFE
jgi:hypothetical protein